MTKLGKLLTSVIDGGAINRPKDAIGHVGRTRDLEKVSAREAGEGFAVHSSRLVVACSSVRCGGWRPSSQTNGTKWGPYDKSSQLKNRGGKLAIQLLTETADRKP